MKAELERLVGTPYRLGAEVKDGEWPPEALDCSELVELCFKRQGIKCPDGSWNQHADSVSVNDPRPGDLGFFCKKERQTGANPYGIYHVGIVFDDKMMVEARAKDRRGRYGKVILRPREKWEAFDGFKNAGGYRRLKVTI